MLALAGRKLSASILNAKRRSGRPRPNGGISLRGYADLDPPPVVDYVKPAGPPPAGAS